MGKAATRFQMMGPFLKTHWRNAFGIALLCGSLLGWGLSASRGWDTPGMLGHEFRQTQTALSIQAMQREGFRLDYPTPILGKPWSIPMEFPLYQLAVSSYCDLTGTGVVQGGRMVSAIFFVVGLFGLVVIGRVEGFTWGGSAIAVLPVVVAPVYLYYSRTVMIESMAWAAAVWFLGGILYYRSRQNGWGLAWALSAGALAVLIKATTWAAFCLPWAVLFFHDAYRTWKSKGVGLRSLVLQAFGIGVPLLALGFGWVAWADSVKAQNPLAHFLLSTELKSFNFGTWDMRFDPERLAVIKDHWSTTFLPGWLWLGTVGATLVWASRRLLIVALVTGFVGIQFIFFNLYFAHDYYFFANAALGCLIVGIAAASLWDRPGKWYRGVLPAIALVVSVGSLQLKAFSEGFERLQLSRSDGFTALSMVIPAITEPDEVLVAHSPNWNSAEAFYGNRRMLMIADFQMYSHRDRVAQSLALLEDESVPLLMVMGESRIHSEWVGERIEDFSLWPLPLFETDTAITVYARFDRWRQMREIITQGDFAGITLSTEPPRAPVDARVATVGSPGESVFSQAGMHPISSVFPFGLGGYQDSVGWVVSTHAPTEIYFEVPASATQVSFQFGLGDGVADQRDFDGLGVNLELIHPDGEATLIHSEWMAPGTDRVAREIVVKLPEERPNQMLYHVVPGPQNHNAFDQAWLRYLRFE